jgi:transcriptional regulator with XRE-family HTH domain
VRVDWTPAEIRRRRDAKGLSQEELGQRLGEHLDKPVSRRAINNWENGHAIPHGRNIRALDLVLGDQPSAGDPTLSQADDLELLAEIARRMSARRATPDSSVPPLPTGHHKIYTHDMPSAQRNQGIPQRGHESDAQEL